MPLIPKEKFDFDSALGTDFSAPKQEPEPIKTVSTKVFDFDKALNAPIASPEPVKAAESTSNPKLLDDGTPELGTDWGGDQSTPTENTPFKPITFKDLGLALMKGSANIATTTGMIGQLRDRADKIPGVGLITKGIDATSPLMNSLKLTLDTTKQIMDATGATDPNQTLLGEASDYARNIGKDSEAYWQEGMTSEGKNPTHFANKVLMSSAESIPGMAAMAALSAPMAAATRGLPILMKMGRLGAFLETSIPAGVGEGIFSAAQNAAQTGDGVRETDFAALERLPEYQKALASTPVDIPLAARQQMARESMARHAEDQVFITTAPWTAITGAATGGTIANLLKKAGGRGIVKELLKNTLEEAGQETIQSAGEQALQNAADQRFRDPNVGIMDGVGEAALVGGASGGLLGAMGGGLNAGLNRSAVVDRARNIQDIRDVNTLREVMKPENLQMRAMARGISEAEPTAEEVFMDAMKPGGMFDQIRAKNTPPPLPGQPFTAPDGSQSVKLTSTMPQEASAPVDIQAPAPEQTPPPLPGQTTPTPQISLPPADEPLSDEEFDAERKKESDTPAPDEALPDVYDAFVNENKPTADSTPEEWDDYESGRASAWIESGRGEGRGVIPPIEHGRRETIKDAMERGEPINAEAFDIEAAADHPVKLRDGYTLDGESYVFNSPEASAGKPDTLKSEPEPTSTPDGRDGEGEVVPSETTPTSPEMMTAGEYANHIATLPPAQHSFIPATQNEHKMALYGQAADAYKALKAGRPVSEDAQAALDKRVGATKSPAQKLNETTSRPSKALLKPVRAPNGGISIEVTPIAETQNAEDEFKAMSDEDIDKAISDAAEPEKPATPAAKLNAITQKKTGKAIAKEAATHAVEGAKNWQQGLNELFGKGTMSMGVGFDSDKYAKAKPYFQKGLDDFKASGKSAAEFISWCVKNWGAEIAPYLKRFRDELKAVGGVLTPPEEESNIQTQEGGNTDVPASKPLGEGGQGSLAKVPPGNVPEAPGAGQVRQPDQGTGGDRKGPVRESGESGNGSGVGDRSGTPVPAGRDARPDGTDRGRNYRLTPDDAVGSGGVDTKYRQNLDAISLVKMLESENRTATPEEQKILVKYVGWGGMPQVFSRNFDDVWDYYQAEKNGESLSSWKKDSLDDAKKDKWWKQYAELRSLLTESEYEAARASTTNAHYTSPTVISGMYKALNRLGFNGGRMIEPSAGVGHFLGLQPDMAKSTSWTAVELDTITGSILKHLYPESNAHVTGFEKVKLPDNFFDVAISNVPFGDYKLHDPQYNKYRFLIHDYFFAKSLDKVRPGGFVAFVTSHGTLDKLNGSLRDYISEKGGKFIGAIRLPKTAFKGNAGTEVITDIIILQKMPPGEKVDNSAWDNIADVKVNDGETVSVNQYFVDHPEMVLGKFSAQGSMYRANEMTVEPNPGDLADHIAKAIERLPKGIYVEKTVSPTGKSEAQKPEPMPAPAEMKDGNLSVKDGVIYQKNGTMLEAIDAPRVKNVVDRVEKAIPIRTAARDLLKAQMDRADDATVADKQKALSKVYDAFVKKYGPVNLPENKKAVDSDVDAPLLWALEDYDQDTKTAKKRPIFTERVIIPPAPVERSDNVKDALWVSLNETGAIDLPRIATLVGDSLENVTAALEESGEIFMNPETHQHETRSEYLSGYVRTKLAAAEGAASHDSRFKKNVEELKAVQPTDLTEKEISPRLGSVWIPTSDYAAFMAHITNSQSEEWSIVHNSVTGGWSINTKEKGGWRAQGIITGSANTQKWGTPDWRGHELVEAMMNGKVPKVKRVDDEGKTYVDRTASALAQEKAERIKEEFVKWVWDSERRDRLVKTYNEEMNDIVERKFDGSRLELPGMNPVWKMNLDSANRSYQKNVIMRGITGGNLLLAHAVGAGKTLEMASIAMELRRLGIAKKPMFTIPNHMIEQWASDFKQMFPASNVLIGYKEDLSTKKRKAFLARIATGNWDAVVIAHSAFGKIGMSSEYQQEYLRQEIKEIEDAILAAQAEESDEGGGGYGRRRGKKRDNKVVKQLEKQKMRIQERIQRLQAAEKKDAMLSFEETGVDYLFVDEAHNFKGLPIYTKRERVAGLQGSTSQKAVDLEMKTRYLTNLHGGKRGIVFATGTPISNSISEAYVMGRYLGRDAMMRRGVSAFDDWANSFGDVINSIEVTPTGAGYRVHPRFAQFVNVGELVQMFHAYADVILSRDLDIQRPKVKGGKMDTHSAKPTDWLKTFIDSLVKRAEAIKTGTVDPRHDNMLNITNDGRKAALDERLIDPSRPDNPASKLNLAVNQVYGIWKESKATSAAQLVFCDLGVPKSKGKTSEAADNESEPVDEVSESGMADTGKFDVYSDIKKKLIKMGVPAKEIAFIQDAKNDAEKAELFSKVRQGKVRVLIGNTPRMGEGTNVQKNLIAIHHLDVPWKPAHLEQRNGRIIRPGNQNAEVGIHAYVTEASFDAYMWQTVERKAKFIDDYMKVGIKTRIVEDIDSTALTAAEIKAIASGDPRVMEKIKLESDIGKMETRQAAYELERSQNAWAIRSRKENIQGYENSLKGLANDLEKYKAQKPEEFAVVLSNGKTVTDKEQVQAEYEKAIANTELTGKATPVGTYAGFEFGTQLFTNGIQRKINLYVRHNGYTWDEMKATDVKSVDRTIVSHLSSMSERTKWLNDQIDKQKKELDVLENSTAKFEDQEKLDNLRERLSVVNKDLGITAGDHSADDMSQDDDASDVQHGPTPAGIINKSMRPVAPAVGSPVSTADVMQAFKDKFGTILRFGKYRGPMAGIYKTKAEVARIKKYGDIGVAAHEVAHDVAKKTKILRGITKDMRQELAALDYEPKGRVSEGFAEFMRLLLTTDNEAQSESPEFHRWFVDEWMPAHPEYQDAITSTTDMIKTWREQGSTARVTAQIDNRSEGGRRLERLVEGGFARLWHDFYRTVFNRHIAAWKAQWAMTGSKMVYDFAENAPADVQFATMMKVLNMAAPSRVAAFINTGTVNYRGEKTGDSMKEILSPIAKQLENKDTLLEFQGYMYARHAIDVIKAGKDPGISLEDAEHTVNEWGSRPGWETAANGITAWHDSLLDYLIDAGGLTTEAKAKMRATYPNYVPLLRSMNDQMYLSNGSGGRRLVDLVSPLRRMKGSGRQVLPPLESSMVMAEKIIAVADKLRIHQALISASETYPGAGHWIEKVPAKIMAEDVQLKRIKEDLEAAGADLSKADMDAVTTIFTNLYEGNARENTIVLWKNGELQMYEVDPDLYKALTAVDEPAALHVVLKWILGKPARLMRLTTTGLRAGFSLVTNPSRDVATSTMQTRVKGWHGTLIAKMFDGAIGMYEDVAGTEIARLFEAGGGSMTNQMAQDRDLAREALEDITAVTWKGKAKNKAMHPIRTIRDMLSVTELGPRIAEFKHVLRQMGWKPGQPLTQEMWMRAQLAASDVTVDFRQGGSLALWANQIIAFHNVGLQDPLQVFQALKRNPTAAFAKALLWLTLPALWLWWKFLKDDEEYQNLPAWEKYGFFHARINGELIRVAPRPFMWGFIFTVLPEAMLNARYAKDPHAVKDMFGQLWQNALPNFIPTAVTAPMNMAMNYDTFRNSPIENAGMKNRKPQDRYNESNTELAKWTASYLGMNGLQVSPAMMDYAASQTTGGMATDLERGAETALRATGALPMKGTRPDEAKDIPVVGRFFIRSGTTRVFDDFYTHLNDLQQAAASAKFNGQVLPPKDRQTLYVMTKASKVLAQQRADLNARMKAMAMTDEMKTATLEKVRANMEHVAKSAMAGKAW